MVMSLNDNTIKQVFLCLHIDMNGEEPFQTAWPEFPIIEMAVFTTCRKVAKSVGLFFFVQTKAINLKTKMQQPSENRSSLLEEILGIKRIEAKQMFK